MLVEPLVDMEPAPRSCGHTGPCECGDSLDVVVQSLVPFDIVSASPVEKADRDRDADESLPVASAASVSEGDASGATRSEDPSTQSAPSPRVPWYRSRWCRVLTVRIIMRLSMIGLIIGLGFLFSFRTVINKYSDWIAHFSPGFVAVLIFTIFASLIAAVAPGTHTWWGEKKCCQNASVPAACPPAVRVATACLLVW